MDTIDDAVLVIGDNGDIQHFNRRAAALYDVLAVNGTVSMDCMGPSEPWNSARQLLLVCSPESGRQDKEVRDPLSGRAWSISAHSIPVQAQAESLKILRLSDVSEIAELRALQGANQGGATKGALSAVALRRHSERKKEQLNAPTEDNDPFLGISRVILRLKEAACRFLDSDCPILIQGETGSGKNVLASWIHRKGPRANQKFLELNCAGLASELLESELFGHQKGAFTSAFADKPGLLSEANGGTVFLDEIGDTSLSVQSKLLKVLEEHRFRRLGGITEYTSDIRLISATHRDLQELMETGSFRRDFYYRIQTVPIRVPALRERPEDIPVLAWRLLNKVCKAQGTPSAVLEERALESLQQYSWPGNIRELENVLRRAVLLTDDGRIDISHLRFDSLGEGQSCHLAPPISHVDRSLQEVEWSHIDDVLREEKGSVQRAARRLGIARSSLYNKLRSRKIGMPTTGNA
jgi:transcriptional regulator with PAS, ATPase and Fis domain